MNPYSITPYAEDIIRANKLTETIDALKARRQCEIEDYERPDKLKNAYILSGEEVLKKYPESSDYIESHICIGERSYFMILEYERRSYIIYLDLYTSRYPYANVCQGINRFLGPKVSVQTGNLEIETPIVIIKKEELK